MNANPYVISIAAVSGGGKTAVTNELGSKLKGSKIIRTKEEGSY